ncbi:uncharacterized protein LOC133352362 [Lethenteron reissneri]|uniref:uncharacterized protein LOC133352362 n=1 Tax=Lethenteron reissneri TaxID=7753 RepID=UPI002AB70F1A|nr:uncharacterized protein LOC133352362 [Lethenteron reissneri]
MGTRWRSRAHSWAQSLLFLLLLALLCAPGAPRSECRSSGGEERPAPGIQPAAAMERGSECGSREEIRADAVGAGVGDGEKAGSVMGSPSPLHHRQQQQQHRHRCRCSHHHHHHRRHQQHYHNHCNHYQHCNQSRFQHHHHHLNNSFYTKYQNATLYHHHYHHHHRHQNHHQPHHHQNASNSMTNYPNQTHHHHHRHHRHHHHRHHHHRLHHHHHHRHHHGLHNHRGRRARRQAPFSWLPARPSSTLAPWQPPKRWGAEEGPPQPGPYAPHDPPDADAGSYSEDRGANFSGFNWSIVWGPTLPDEEITHRAPYPGPRWRLQPTQETWRRLPMVPTLSPTSGWATEDRVRSLYTTAPYSSTSSSSTSSSASSPTLSPAWTIAAASSSSSSVTPSGAVKGTQEPGAGTRRVEQPSRAGAGYMEGGGLTSRQSIALVAVVLSIALVASLALRIRSRIAPHAEWETGWRLRVLPPPHTEWSRLSWRR